MAFGFFKKNVTADLVLKNGVIITQDAETPQAEALACKNGKIVTAGNWDSIKTYINDDTEVVDLQGRYAVPGFISLWERPSLEVFSGKYLDLTLCSSTEEILASLSAWAESHSEDEMLFGFGFNEGIFGKDFLNNQDTAAAFIDSSCIEKPVVLLCENNISCICNSQAREIVLQTAEEEMVRYITTPYILNLFIPFDFEEIEKNVSEQINKRTKMGITSVLNMGAPDYFESIYQDSLISLYHENSMHQRFFSSYMLNRPLLPNGLIHRLMQMKTACNEMNGLINANLLFVRLNQKSCPMDFSQQSLNTILEETADKGFDIYMLADDEMDFEKAYLAAEHVRNKGYKNMIAVESSHVLSDDLKKELIYHESVHSISDNNKAGLWQDAPLIIGCSNSLGCIKAGYLADIAVYDSDPYKNLSDGLPSSEAYMTIFNGAIVYR